MRNTKRKSKEVYSMKKTNESITKEDVKKALQELLCENIVGFMEKEEENGFIYRFPGGKRYEITIKEV